jgi:hypothetical protein
MPERGWAPRLADGARPGRRDAAFARTEDPARQPEPELQVQVAAVAPPGGGKQPGGGGKLVVLLPLQDPGFQTGLFSIVCDIDATGSAPEENASTIYYRMGAATAPQRQGDGNVPRRQGSSGPLLNCT